MDYDDITVTDQATDQIKQLMQQDEQGNIVAIRAFVQGGGCSGFQYGFAFADKIDPDDNVFKINDITVLIDRISEMYLKGCTIDYTNSMQGSRFTIKNPNAKTTCGCGSSFTT